MRYQAIAAGLMLILIGTGAALASDIYKWVDEEGNPHFGDVPAGEQAERLDIESRPTDPARIQAMNEARAVDRAETVQAKAAAELERPSAAELQEEADERANKCAAYKIQLESYTNNRRLYKASADGEREYLSDDEIAATRELAAQRVDEFCS